MCFNEAWGAPPMSPPMWQGVSPWLSMPSGGGDCPNSGIRVGVLLAAGAGSRSEPYPSNPLPPGETIGKEPFLENPMGLPAALGPPRCSACSSASLPCSLANDCSAAAPRTSGGRRTGDD